MTIRYDAVVVGTGQAGPPLANRLSQEGLSVAVVERDRVGGTCVNVGCTPTKTLVASARAAHVARRAEEFGVLLEGPIRVDMRRVKARMQEVAGQSNRGVTRWLEGMERVTLYRGHARLQGPSTVAVDDELLEADRIFLNVGTRARVPDWPGLSDVDYLTSSSILELESLPEHLIIVGGSYIGLEFGQMYRRFGSEVTIVERGPNVIGRDDSDVSDEVRSILEREGVRFRLNADCFLAAKHGDDVAIQVECEDGSPEVVGSHLLVAVGRVPNTDDLGLGSAGVETDDRGFVEVDHQLQTKVPGIWALGDCNGRGAFTHTAYNDFEIVAANLFDADARRVSDRILCYGLFVDPPLARVGMSEHEALASGRRVLVARRAMTRVGRARERGETQGFMKVLVDADSEEILGATTLGVGGDEAIHSLLDVMYARAPYTVVSRAVHIHPTVAELLPTLLQELEPLARREE